MSDLDVFLTERHDLSERTKTEYRLAFQALGKYVADPCNVVDDAKFHEALESLSRDYKASSWNAYVNCIRSFYKWKHKHLTGRDEYPDLVRGVKMKKVRRLDYVAKKILSEDEVKKLLAGCAHPRDRALVAVAIATGARKGELMSMKLQDIEVHPYGFRIIVTGKTGTHKTPPIVGGFAKILSVWLEHHPQRDKSDSPLWPRLKAGAWGKQVEGIRRVELHNVIKRAAKNAGLKRNVHWHMLRHTENTWATKKGVSRASRNIMHGWSESSNTAAVYENLTDEDAEKEYLRGLGVEKLETVKDEFETVKCTYCGEDNPATAKACLYCFVPLDAKKAEEFLKDRLTDEDHDFLKLIRDPRFRKFAQRGMEREG